MSQETEIKVQVADAAEACRRIESLGAVPAGDRAFEDNRLFDLPGLVLSGSGRLLRVREFAGRWTVTAKGPVTGASRDFKIRREFETRVDDGAALVAILELLGFQSVWRYQKYRREYHLAGASIVVDEIPHGVFVEIEGEPAAIEDVARRLGFDRSSWMTSSYREIHEQHCRRAQVHCGDMVFGAGRAS